VRNCFETNNIIVDSKIRFERKEKVREIKRSTIAGEALP
jgi:hypothetical protein